MKVNANQFRTVSPKRTFHHGPHTIYANMEEQTGVYEKPNGEQEEFSLVPLRMEWVPTYVKILRHLVETKQQHVVEELFELEPDCELTDNDLIDLAITEAYRL